MKYRVINSFDSIDIGDNSLLLCDIDETLFTNKLVRFQSKENKSIIKLILPKYTDKQGFLNLLNKIRQTDSKLYFVTARDIRYFDFTRKQFKLLGINLVNFPVYFCGTTPKGFVIKNQIKLDNFKKIIFLDDLKYNLDNVKKEFGDKIECILFKK